MFITLCTCFCIFELNLTCFIHGPEYKLPHNNNDILIELSIWLFLRTKSHCVVSFYGASRF